MMSAAAVDAGLASLAFDLAVTPTAPAGFDLAVVAGTDASATGDVEVVVTRRDQPPAKTRRGHLALRRE